MTNSDEQPHCLFESPHELAEGPLWDASNACLYWVDIEDKALHRLYPASGEHQQWHFVDGITSISLTNSDKLISTTESGFMLLNPDMSVAWKSADVEMPQAGNRFNDAKVGPDGLLWAGTMDRGLKRESGALYCLNSKLEWAKADDGYVISNGPAFSLNGTVMYHTDSFKKEIYQFDMAANGQISNKRVFAILQDHEGIPDGMTTDAEDCLWVCSFFAARITRFSPTGERLTHIELPVPNITSCAFGGSDYKTMYITTAWLKISEEPQADAPLAGSIFQWHPGVAGLAPNNFILAEHLL
jgi:sugar lactone lactonase YvrE